MMEEATATMFDERLPVAMTGEDKDCVSFLLTLKHRSVTPDLTAQMDEGWGSNDAFVETLIEKRKDETWEREEGIPSHVGSTSATQDEATRSFARTAQSMPLALAEDEHWLSELHCFVRSSCTEFFVAGGEGSRSSSRSGVAGGSSGCGGRRGPVTAGRVGIRCVFCREAAPSSRASQATSFPSQISGIYGAVVMMQCRHFPHCHLMPDSVRETLASMKRGGGGTSSTPPPSFHFADQGSCVGGTYGRQQYWADSARKLGLVDTADGIRFCHEVANQGSVATPIGCVSSPAGRAQPEPRSKSTSPFPETGDDESLPSKKLPSSEASIRNAVKDKAVVEVKPRSSGADSPGSYLPADAIDLADEKLLCKLLGDSKLVKSADKDLVPDYLFVAMAQMKPCNLSEADRVGCYKGRPLGFVGMACKHCGGQPGFGKYFPATVRSLAQTTTSQTILKHVGFKCRQCPPHIREAVVALQQDSHTKEKAPADPTEKVDGRPRYGSRKVFFQRVWGRLHDEEVPELPAPQKTPSAPLTVSNAFDDSSVQAKTAPLQTKSLEGENPPNTVISSYDSEESDSYNDDDDRSVASSSSSSSALSGRPSTIYTAAVTPSGDGDNDSLSRSVSGKRAISVDSDMDCVDEDDEDDDSSYSDASFLVDHQNRRVVVRGIGAPVRDVQHDGQTEPRKPLKKRKKTSAPTTKSNKKSRPVGVPNLQQ